MAPCLESESRPHEGWPREGGGGARERNRAGESSQGAGGVGAWGVEGVRERFGTTNPHRSSK